MIWKLCKEQYPGIIEMARVFTDRGKNNYDNHVTIEGGTGSGKSMFTFTLVHVQAHIIGRNFNLENQTLFIPDQGELKKAVKSLDPIEALWLDEAIRSLDKKQWYKLDQIELNHIVKTERWRGNTIYYNIQRFAELTETFRNDNIKFRIYVIPRYAAILYVKDEDKDVEDPWHVRNNLSIKYFNPNKGQTRYKAIMPPSERLMKERKLPNYYMDSFYPNLEEHEVLKEYWAYYQALKKRSREIEKQKEEKGKEPIQTAKALRVKQVVERLTAALSKEMGVPKVEIYRRFGKDLVTESFFYPARNPVESEA